MLVPGGFGDRGVQGKIVAAKYARENRIPFLGICLGMQIAVIEFARSVLGLQDANSTEFDPETRNPCVVSMPEVWLTFILEYLFSPSCIIVLSFYPVSRFRRLIWEALCDLDQGEHIFTSQTVNLQNCEHF